MTHVLIPRPCSILYTNTLYSKCSIGIHYADPSSMGVVSSSPPVETSADVASPCFDWTGSVQLVLHMQALWQRQLQKGCSQQRGTVGSRGGPGMAVIFGPGGPIILPWTVRGGPFEGDCPQRDRSSTPLHSLVPLVTPSCAKLHLHV